MYRILIADDSQTERECILFLIQKNRLPLIPRTACNGKEALELLEKEPFDILFTDIKMPFMDGLELCEHVTALKPEMKVIIFSSFSEFEYAKSALRLGVREYLLKPIHPDEFERSINTLTAEIEKEAQAKKLLAHRLDYVKRHMLLLLINNVPAGELDSGNSSPISLDFLDEYKRILLLELQSDFYSGPGMDFEHYMQNHFPLSFDYLNIHPNQSLLFLKENISDGELFALLRNFINTVEKDYRQILYTAFGPTLKNRALNAYYKKLEELMEKRFFYPNRRVFYAHMERTDGFSSSEPLSLEILETDIHHKDYTALNEHLNYIFNSLNEAPDYSQLYVKFLFSSIIKEVSHLLPPEKQGSLESKIEKIYMGTDIHQLKEIVFNATTLLEESVPAPPIHTSRVNAVKDHIHRNYGDDLSLDVLAGIVYVHPDYLCRIFKQETGQTLNKYIKSFRMEKAKEYVETTPIKIQDIGKFVGYQNTSYFCQSFRDYYGISPEKMRQQNKGLSCE